MLTTHNLELQLGGKTLCKDLNLHFNGGEIWVLLGQNGAGKTTLLHTLAGLRAANSGEIMLAGEALQSLSPKKRAQRLGLLFQDSTDNFPASVLESVLIGRHPFLGPLALESEQDKQSAEAALAAVGLADFGHREIMSLSGGERRRVAIAALLTQNPRIWLLDEPNNHLDLHHQISILDLLQKKISATQACLLMSLHDVNLAARYASHGIMLFENGEHAQGPLPELLNTDNLQRLYRHPIKIIQGDDRAVYLPC